MRPFTIYLHPDADLSEIDKVPPEFRPFDLIHLTQDQMESFKWLVAPDPTADEWWPSQTPYIVEQNFK